MFKYGIQIFKYGIRIFKYGIRIFKYGIRIYSNAEIQSEAPIVDNCMWGKRQLYHTFLIIQNRISNHIHVFVYGKGRIPCG